MMLSMFFYTLYNLVDAYWVAKLSPDAIAAVSISQITLFIMISLAMGISIGSAVLMGMNMGAGNKQEAERILGQAYALAGIVAVFFYGAGAYLWSRVPHAFGRNRGYFSARVVLFQHYSSRIDPDIPDDDNIHCL